jgi:hypothetical protein
LATATGGRRSASRRSTAAGTAFSSPTPEPKMNESPTMATSLPSVVPR